MCQGTGWTVTERDTGRWPDADRSSERGYLSSTSQCSYPTITVPKRYMYLLTRTIPAISVHIEIMIKNPTFWLVDDCDVTSQILANKRLLDPSHVFILDAGDQLIQWNGALCNSDDVIAVYWLLIGKLLHYTLQEGHVLVPTLIFERVLLYKYTCVFMVSSIVSTTTLCTGYSLRPDTER